VAEKVEKLRKENAIQKWWRETIGELRKVTWPPVPDALRLTRVVLLVMLGMSILLGILDFIFSTIMSLLLA